LNLNTNAVTILAWLYPNGHIINSNGMVFSGGSTYPVGLGYLGLRFPEDEIGYTWNQDNYDTYYWTSKLFVPPGQWSFVALTIAPTQAILYLGTNGVLHSATNAIAHDLEAWDGPTSIGADTRDLPGTVFNGKMDEVAVFNYTLSPAQIGALYETALYGGPITLTCETTGTNLVLNWPRTARCSKRPTSPVRGPSTMRPHRPTPSFATNRKCSSASRNRTGPIADMKTRMMLLLGLILARLAPAALRMSLFAPCA
jgi:hypothetical protein